VADHDAESGQRRALCAGEHAFRHAIDELSQHMRVQRGDDAVRGLEALTALEFEPDRAAARGQDFADFGIAAHLTAVVLDATDQRLAEPAAAAHRLGDAEAVHEPGHQEHAESGTQFVRSLQVLTDQPQQPDLDVLALEALIRDLQRAALHGLENLAAFIGLIHHGEEGPHGIGGA